MKAGIQFALPHDAAPSRPAEAQGLARDEVRLLIAMPDGLHHARFSDLGDWLRSGDLLVVNTSATLPSAVDGFRPDGSPIVVHFSSPVDKATWMVEIRRPDGSGPVPDGGPTETLLLPDRARLRILAAQSGKGNGPNRLWHARIEAGRPIEQYLGSFGRPITYGPTVDRWPLSTYQTIFARQPGSAEMPSAARPFTDALVTRLLVHGISIAPVVLHAGVSSLDAKEPPQVERFEVSSTTARLVNQARDAGGRVIAVGTTVTRALETTARRDGRVVPRSGKTNLVLGPQRATRVVDGLITGWHAPGASHLLLLEAVAGADLVQRAYDEAVRTHYRWHEFGDSCLFLPPRRPRPAGDTTVNSRPSRKTPATSIRHATGLPRAPLGDDEPEDLAG
jgi:S-adenosylmethionine:tRNA ribosyltransferase-isomerase